MASSSDHQCCVKPSAICVQNREEEKAKEEELAEEEEARKKAAKRREVRSQSAPCVLQVDRCMEAASCEL